jgi:hypothetical protein
MLSQRFKRIAKVELDEYRKNFNIISERLIAGRPEITVLSEVQPDASFTQQTADLEDVYFSQIFNSTKETANV